MLNIRKFKKSTREFIKALFNRKKKNKQEDKKEESVVYVDFQLAKRLSSLFYDWSVNNFYIYDPVKNNHEFREKGWIDYYKKKDKMMIIYPAPSILDVVDWIYIKHNIRINYKFDSKSYIITDNSSLDVRASYPNTTPISKVLLYGIREAVNRIK